MTDNTDKKTFALNTKELDKVLFGDTRIFTRIHPSMKLLEEGDVIEGTYFYSGSTDPETIDMTVKSVRSFPLKDCHWVISQDELDLTRFDNIDALYEGLFEDIGDFDIGAETQVYLVEVEQPQIAKDLELIRERVMDHIRKYVRDEHLDNIDIYFTSSPYEDEPGRDQALYISLPREVAFACGESLVEWVRENADEKNIDAIEDDYEEEYYIILYDPPGYIAANIRLQDKQAEASAQNAPAVKPPKPF